jgi:hypothetical protein
MEGMRSFRKRALAAVVAAIVALMIAILPQGIWSALITLNLRTSPTIPWAEVVMAGLLILHGQYLGGRFPPRRTSETRRHHLRASRVPLPMFAWAILAGSLAVVALTGVWITPQDERTLELRLPLGCARVPGDSVWSKRSTSERRQSLPTPHDSSQCLLRLRRKWSGEPGQIASWSTCRNGEPSVDRVFRRCKALGGLRQFILMTASAPPCAGRLRCLTEVNSKRCFDYASGTVRITWFSCEHYQFATVNAPSPNGSEPFA